MLFKIALKELNYDRLMNFCQITAIACIIAPLLLLFSLRHGILSELEDNLVNDPSVLSLTLDTSYRLDDNFFEMLRAHEETGFVVPEITALNALVDIKFPGGVKRMSVLPTALGDPVVLGSKIPFTEKEHDLSNSEVFISEAVAVDRKLKVGDTISIMVSRTMNSVREAVKKDLVIRGIISERFVRDDTIMVCKDLINAIDDYRNGYNPALISDGSYEREGKRYYAKFRLYAKDVDSVIPLYYLLVSKKLNVSSKVKDIENVKAIQHVLNFVFGVIASVSIAGGSIALGGLMLSSLRARKRNLVLLRLMGHSESDIYKLVIIESLIIALIGFVAGLAMYAIGSAIFNFYFMGLLAGSVISQLTLVHILAFFSSTLGLSLIVALLSVKYVFLKVQIADVLREA